jgi:hypothetical protein
MRRSLMLVIGLLLLFAMEILRVYYIMPFPGSQHNNTIRLAYFLNNYIVWFRVIGLLLVVPSAFYFFGKARMWKKILLGLVLAFYAFIFYMFNFRFLADKMFYQPKNKVMVDAETNKVDTNQLVIGAVINGQAKAYPIQIIGYHHQVQDTVGGQPVMVTYCTVCRTGRVFSPFIDGKFQHFRLVGMDHFNAMFEDEDTKSWWRQVTGEAIAGPLKGKQLAELPSAQMRLSAWIREYPQTLIMQPDTVFVKRYAGLQGYDSGTIDGSLEKRDSSSWELKSWVVGVVQKGSAKAYDWNELEKQGIINDSFAHTPVVLVLENYGATFHVWNRNLNGQTLNFEKNPKENFFIDSNTHSQWAWNGICTDGRLKGSRLNTVQSYQEFWHSWKTFHPLTLR